MKKISTGENSTLGTYRKIAVALCGEGSKAVKFFDEKISQQSEDEEVIADEQQVMYLIFSMMEEKDMAKFKSQ